MKFAFIFLLTFLVGYFLVLSGLAGSITMGGNVFAVRTIISVIAALLVAWKVA